MASPVAEEGYVGGCFNATTRLKMVPLPAMHNPRVTSRKGLRNVCIHSERYNPTNSPEQTMKRLSDSLSDLKKLQNRQKTHLAEVMDKLKQARHRKVSNRVIPHRADCMFYMNGHSANINRRSMFSQDEMHLLQLSSLSENIHLYYGKGVRIPQRRPLTRTIAKFEEHLKQEAENIQFLEDFDIAFNCTSRAITPAMTILPPHLGRESVMSGVYGRKAAFITEESKEEVEQENSV